MKNSLSDIFIAWLVYTINMYSNMKYCETICNCLRVIQQEKNRKLKSNNCWQRTSLKISRILITSTVEAPGITTTE